MFMIKLGKAGCHFSASRSWCSHNHQRTGGFNIFIFAEAFITDNKRNIAWISCDWVVNICFDSQVFQFGLKIVGASLSGVLGDYHAANVEASGLKGIDETQHIQIISDSKVTTDFVFFNISGADNNNDFRMVGKLHQHF